MANITIAGMTAKATPVAGDLLEIADSAAANAAKKITAGTLPVSTAQQAAIVARLGANFINIADIVGVDITGVADSTTALNAAIAAAPDGTVFFRPPGAVIAANIVINRGEVALVGGGGGTIAADMATDVLVPWDVTLPVLTIGADTGATWRENVVVAGHSIHAVGPNGRGQYGLRLNGGAYHNTIRDCGIRGFTKRSIWIRNSDVAPISLIYFDRVDVYPGTLTANQSAIWMQYNETGSQYVTAIYFNNCHFNGLNWAAADTYAIEQDSVVATYTNCYLDAHGGHAIKFVRSYAGETPLAVCNGMNIDAIAGGVMLKSYVAGTARWADHVVGVVGIDGDIENAGGSSTATMSSGRILTNYLAQLTFPELIGSFYLSPDNTTHDGTLEGEFFAGSLGNVSLQAVNGKHVDFYAGDAFASLRADAGFLLPTYTEATKPSAASKAGQVIYSSDAAAGGKVQASDGTNWVALDAAGGFDTEATQDVVGAMVVSGGGTYDDGAGTVAFPGLDSPFGTLRVVDDFLAGLLTTGNIGSHAWVLSGTYTAVVGEAGHPGIGLLSTGASSGTVSRILLSTALTVGAIYASDLFSFTVLLRLNHNDADTTIRVGLSSNPGTETPADGVWLEKVTSQTTWRRVARAAGTSTTTDTAVATTAAWAAVKVRRIDASTIGYTVAATLAGLAGATEQTLATNVPSAVTLAPFVMIVNAVASAKTVNIDYAELVVSGLSR